MNTTTPNSQMIEHHCLALSYQHTRVAQPQLIRQLADSMADYGQLVPVQVVGQKAPWTLIDGYARVQALHRLGRDTVEAQVSDASEEEALLLLMLQQQSRARTAVEESLLLGEWQTRYPLSTSQLAEKLGRSQSWVARRLSLTQALPENIVNALVNDQLSHWVGVRVLLPMARAIPEHAQSLLTYLTTADSQPSTRELISFYHCYQRSSKKQRQSMMKDPGLFFKVKAQAKQAKAAKKLADGPEGLWQHHLSLAQHHLQPLLELCPQVFAGQDSAQQADLLAPFEHLHHDVDALNHAIKQARAC